MIYKRILENMRQVKPNSFFLIVSFIAGITFLIVTPPFQVPDEINHFYKSYQISEGKFLSETTDNRLGGYIPKSLVETTQSFSGLRWNTNAKTSFKAISNHFSVPLNEDNKIFIDFPNTALYSPVSYLPQAFSIFILRNLNCSPIFIFYGARLFTLLVWIICIWLAIKITPIYKWLFVLLALLPMSIFINMSLSADIATTILAFLLIAYFLKLTFEDKKIDLKKISVVTGLSVLLASAKLVYTPIILLFLLIPKRNFKNTREFYLYFIFTLVLGFGTALLWSKIINIQYIPYEDYNVAYRDGVDLVKGSNIHKQLDHILNNGLYIFEVLVNSMYQQFHTYYTGYIGIFGWLEIPLPTEIIHFSYLFIIFVVIFENNENLNFSVFQRFVIFGSLIATIALILLSQHLTWNIIGGDIIHIQGRYFIPVFPLLFILFNNSKYNKQFLTSVIVMLLSVALLCFSARKVYLHYYIAPDFDTIKIECDAEGVVDKYLTTSIPDIYFEYANNRSSRYSRSGDFSIELSSEKPFGFTYKLYNCKMGDVIEIEVWRFGKSGSIILAGDSGKAFYLASSEVIETDPEGWEKLRYSYTLQSNMKGTEIITYLYNDSHDASYFDDFSISINNKLK